MESGKFSTRGTSDEEKVSLRLKTIDMEDMEVTEATEETKLIQLHITIERTSAILESEKDDDIQRQHKRQCKHKRSWRSKTSPRLMTGMLRSTPSWPRLSEVNLLKEWHNNHNRETGAQGAAQVQTRTAQNKNETSDRAPNGKD